MRSTLISTSVLLALSPSALAIGSAHVINNCGASVYYASVAQNLGQAMNQLQGSYSEQYGQIGNGISIKLAPNPVLAGSITQFEFTRADGRINYDMSNINGNPFAGVGMHLQPSVPPSTAYPTCIAVDCPAGQATCDAAYNHPDDVRTLVCSETTDLTLTLCPGGASNGSSSGTGSGSPTASGSGSAGSAGSSQSSSPSNVAGSAASSAPSSSASPWHESHGPPGTKRDEHAVHNHMRAHSRQLLRK